PRRALRHRRRDFKGWRRSAGGRARRGRDAPPGRNREKLPARVPPAPQRLDLGSRAAALGREILERTSSWPRERKRRSPIAARGERTGSASTSTSSLPPNG